jgi:multidrug resistance protein
MGEKFDDSWHQEVESGMTNDGLSDAHKEFLLSRHGRVDLDPLPSMSLDDPLNFPQWKKVMNLIGVSLQSLGGMMMCTVVLPSLTVLSEVLDTEFTKVSYYGSVPILFLGLSTLFWKPIANRYGRRPVWIVSTFISIFFALGSALCNSYGVMMTMRVFSGIFHAPALSIGGATIGETFFAHERGRQVGIWSLAFTIGPPLGALLGGICVYQTDNWRWSYWLLLIYIAFTLVFVILFCPETLYVRDQAGSSNVENSSDFVNKYIKVRRIKKTPFRWYELVEPFIWAKYLPVAVAFFAHGMCNSLTSPGITIILPKNYEEIFGFNVQQVALQYLALMVGLLIGEQIGGPLSDFLMNRGKKNGQHPSPEFRLWGVYPGYALAIAGVMLYLAMLHKYEQEHHGWTIVPEIGIAMASVGNQLITVIVITYAIDKMGVANSGTVSNSINQYRQIWAFLAPFFFNPMYDNLGLLGAGGLMSGLIALTMLPLLYMHLFGKRHEYDVLSSDNKENN